MCHLCSSAPATLTHVFCDCPNTAYLHNKIDVPSAGMYLRVFLLTRRARELHSIVQAWEHLLSNGDQQPGPPSLPW